MAKKTARVSQEPNIDSRTMVVDDNFEVLLEMNDACVDLVYLDPPWNKGRPFQGKRVNPKSGKPKFDFVDCWNPKDIDPQWINQIATTNVPLYNAVELVKASWGQDMYAYMCYMAVRLVELKRVMKDDAAIYLHCDPTISSYLRLALDCIFGRANFRNEIAWCYTGPANVSRWMPRQHDVILFYAASDKHKFNPDRIRIPHKRKTPGSGGTSLAAGGRSKEERHARELELFDKGKLCPDFWTDVGSGSHIPKVEMDDDGKPYWETQKPIKLLERIVAASSDPGDWVLDPFAGCATACVAAEKLGRKWIGIDKSSDAGHLVEKRLNKEVYDLFKLDKAGRAPRIKLAKGVRSAAVKAKQIVELAYNHPKNKQKLFGKQMGLCNGCHEKRDYDLFHVDHIVPTSKGGGHEIENLQLLCGPCNVRKSNKNAESFDDWNDEEAARRKLQTVSAMKELEQQLADMESRDKAAKKTAKRRKKKR